ncbi:sugar phosphate isomerase/epimerase family protein [Gemmatimonadota bacterium]
MKLSLDTVSYCGYFTEGETIPLEEAMKRAARFGYDAIDVFAHRPMGFPLDISADRRKQIVELGQSLELEFAAVECCTSFMSAKHVLLFPQEKEILYVKEACRLAQDLGIKVVRILAGFVGYFMNEYAMTGYGNPAFQSRSLAVSTNDDWLEQWAYVRAGLKEVATIARDYGVTLALQNHPEITNNTEETLEMIEEVGMDNLKVGLDLPLFESQEDEFVRNTVLQVADKMVHSHSISIINKATVGGTVFGWDEVVPGSEKDNCNWEVFLRACKEIGYKGYLAYEQCSPIIIKGHKKAGLEEIDRRNKAQIEFMKPLLQKLDYYTGKKK